MSKIDVACIIDDDEVFVFGARRLMEVVDFCRSVMVFHNGQDALNHLKPLLTSGNQVPEVILLDLNMPVMDGWQFLDEFVKIPSHKRATIFLVTSSIDERDRERAKAYESISEYLVKPITIDSLRDVLRELP